MVERALAAGPEPPERAAAAAEDDDLARIRIVGDEIAAAADLVRVGRVTDARRMTRPVDVAAQAHLIDPVTVYLGDQEMPVVQREDPIRAAEPGGRVMTARGRPAELPANVPPARRYQQDAAVHDVRHQQVAAGQQHRVVRVTEVACADPGT